MNFSAERLSESYSPKFLDERKLRVAPPAKGLLAAIQVMLTSAAPATRRSFEIQCKQSVVNADATVIGWRQSSSLTHQLSVRKGGDFGV